jgi:hypothetical protein
MFIVGTYWIFYLIIIINIPITYLIYKILDFALYTVLRVYTIILCIALSRLLKIFECLLIDSLKVILSCIISATKQSPGLAMQFGILMTIRCW